ncbi:hypothetical protein QE152_g40044, partial [Popillia japonica]
MKRHINRIHKCYLCEKCGGTLETCVHVDRETKRQRLDAAMTSSSVLEFVIQHLDSTGGSL